MPREDACIHALAWLHKAKSDLRNIELVLPAADCPLDTVAFHAQQAAEKSIKALLGFLGIQPPHLHDLEELVAALPENHRTAIAFDPDALALLSQLAVAPRYPGWDDNDLDTETIEHAVDSSRHIYDTIRRHLSELGCE